MTTDASLTTLIELLRDRAHRYKPDAERYRLLRDHEDVTITVKGQKLAGEALDKALGQLRR